MLCFGAWPSSGQEGKHLGMQISRAVKAADCLRSGAGFVGQEGAPGDGRALVRAKSPVP